MTFSENPDLDLKISRIIRAPVAKVWDAWTDPRKLEQWWVPAPSKARVVALELKPGGAFVTEFDENGDGNFSVHMNVCVLAVEPLRRIVFTDALTAGWRPSARPFMTGIFSFEEHPEGTNYVGYAMHNSPAERNRHAELGFFDGWGTVADQLAMLVERKG
ncbi:MAG: SRPBCC family protein [Mesorhizobium sp.]|nr:SRPBCC family protein [Mesorhizobium sp.]MBL8578266.1 SRPBCC family protein [Mesorhizobium sp.]